MVLYSLSRTEASMIFAGRAPVGDLVLPMNLVAADVSRRMCLFSRQRISADSRRRLRFRGSTHEIFFLELLPMNIARLGAGKSVFGNETARFTLAQASSDASADRPATSPSATPPTPPQSTIAITFVGSPVPRCAGGVSGRLVSSTRLPGPSEERQCA